MLSPGAAAAGGGGCSRGGLDLRGGGCGWGSAGVGGAVGVVLVQAVWFDAGAGRAGRLLLVIHHLAVDGVSWRILVPDLAAAWGSIAAGGGGGVRPRRGPGPRRGGPAVV